MYHRDEALDELSPLIKGVSVTRDNIMLTPTSHKEAAVITVT